MKSKIALLLCFVLIALSLFGCSEAELAYLDMSKKLSSETSKVTGVFTGEIDFDALAALVDKTTAKLASDGLYTSDTQVSTELSDLGLKGTQKIKIHYNMLMDLKDSMAFQADFDVEFNNKTYNMGDMYFDASKGMYISKELVAGIYDFCSDLFAGKWDPLYYSKEFRDGLLKAFNDKDYIFVGYLEDGMSPEESAQIRAMMGSMNQEIYDDAYDFLTTAFSGFSTGVLSKISGGYKISLDGNQLKTLITDMLQYMIDNIDKVMGAYKDYTLKILDYAGLTEAEKAETKSALDALFGPESQMKVSTVLAGVKQMFISAEQAGYLDFLDGLKYEATVQQSGDTYKQREETILKDNRKTVFSFISESDMAIETVEINLPTSIISSDDFENGMNLLENSYNAAKSASISWWDYGQDSVFINYEREKESPFSDKREMRYEKYLIIESRLYVPLRSITETLGEKVTWDQNAKKAYIVRGDDQIDMTGILKDSRTYIKVRDFEKLGYKVDYKFEDGQHTAQITK